MTSTEANKRIARRAIEERCRHSDLAVFDELYSPDFVDHVPDEPGAADLAATKAFVAGLRAAYAEMAVTIDDQIAEGDRVATRWTFRGTNVESRFAREAAGTPVTVTGITVSRLHGGRIVEEWTEWDALGLQRLLGIAAAG
jgi:predicted ester cyclase